MRLILTGRPHHLDALVSGSATPSREAGLLRLPASPFHFEPATTRPTAVQYGATVGSGVQCRLA